MVGHAHSISLSLRMSRLTSLFLGQKRYITMFEPNSTYSHCILSHAHRLSRSLSPTRLTLSIARRPYVIGWPCFLPRTKYIYMSVTGSSLKLYLTALTLAKSSIGQYLSRAYIFVQWMSDHTHFVSLSICLSIDLAFSHRIFHALKLLPLHPSQSRSYLHCEGHSNLGLICVGIYSGRFRLYFRSIRPTTTPNTVATHATPLVDFPLARSSLSRTSFLAFNVAPWYYWKNYVVLFNYYK